MSEALGTIMARIAASADPLPDKARALLGALRPAVPFEAAWLGFADHRRSRYVPMACVDLHEDIAEFLAERAMTHDLSVAGIDLDNPVVLSRADRPRPSRDAAAWSDCLARAGIHTSLSVGLFAEDGRHVGLLILLSRSTSPSSRATRRRLAALAPVVAMGIDPMPSLLVAARMVPGVTAGTVLREDGLIEALPGLDGDLLLAVGSPIVSIARRRVDEGLLLSSFLWPLGGAFAPQGHARVTVLATPEDVPEPLLGTALMSPAHDLHGLTPRELEVLGLVVEGCSNQEIAQTLVVAPRTVAAHIEHLLVKLDAGTRTTAAVRAAREGLYVPTVHGPSYKETACGERET